MAPALRRSAGALGLAAFGLVIGWKLGQSSPAARAAAAPPAPNLEAPQSALPQVESELSLLRAEVAGLKEQLSRPPPAPSERPSAPSEPAPKPAQPQPVTVDAAQSHFEQVLEMEPVDVSWARSEERSITDFVLTQAGEGASLQSVTCRSSLCRLRVKFPNDEGRDAFKLKLGLPPLDNGGFYKEEGETELAYYAARKGRALPEIAGE